MSTLSSKIQEVFNEPGCDKNQAKSDKERKKGCTKQLAPGAAAGGCAFDGAKIALQPITDVAHLVHGPIACEGNSWDNRGAKSSGSRLYRTGFTTDINENDVVFGGEKRLYKAIKEIIEKYDPPAVFVYQTCIPAMIGDDINAVCKAASQKFGKPVIPIMSPGFVGPKNLGNKLAGEAILDHVIGTEEPGSPPLMTSTSSASTTCPANCGRLSPCSMRWEYACSPAFRAMRATTTSPAPTGLEPP